MTEGYFFQIGSVIRSMMQLLVLVSLLIVIYNNDLHENIVGIVSKLDGLWMLLQL